MKLGRAVFWAILCVGLGAGCRTPAPPPAAEDAELAKLSRAATLAHRRAGGERARPLFRAALDRAEALGDVAAAGALAYNLAVCLAESGEWEGALEMARAARRDLERAGRAAAEPMSLEAVLLRARGDFEAARRVVAEAVESARAARRSDLEAQILALSAEIAAERGDVAAAERELAAARRAAGRSPAPAIEAGLEAAAGLLASRRKAFDVAAEAYAREARAWGRAGFAPRVPPALLRAAHAARAAGDPARAVEMTLAAARSWAGQGDWKAAQETLELINKLSASDFSPALREEWRALQARVEEALAPSVNPDATP